MPEAFDPSHFAGLIPYSGHGKIPQERQRLRRGAAGRTYRRAAHRIDLRLGRARSPRKPQSRCRKSKKIPERSSAPTKTARGTSMGGAATATERAAAGLNPVAGLDVSLEDAELAVQVRRHRHGRGAVGADRIRQSAVQGRQDVDAAPPCPAGKVRRRHRDQDGLGLRAGRRPADRHHATSSRACENDDRTQVLLGVTGSGKTFTMAKVIEETQRPALILAPNKTLAAQLYSEFKNFFPDNAVEYFVSYYDYYQPEAYVPRTDTFIEKESSINEQIDRMRHSATRSLLERDDCHHRRLGLLHLRYRLGRDLHRHDLPDGGRRPARPARSCSPTSSPSNTSASDINFERGSFRVRGDTIEIFPAHLEDARLAHLACSATRSTASPSSTR